VLKTNYVFSESAGNDLQDDYTLEGNFYWLGFEAEKQNRKSESHFFTIS
jgi:hypothetical protein